MKILTWKLLYSSPGIFLFVNTVEMSLVQQVLSEYAVPKPHHPVDEAEIGESRAPHDHHVKRSSLDFDFAKGHWHNNSYKFNVIVYLNLRQWLLCVVMSLGNSKHQLQIISIAWI